MVDALCIAVSLPPITGAHTLLSIICLSSDTMTFFASCPLVRNASLTLMLAVSLLPISSLCRFITSSTSCVVGDLGTVPPVFVTNASLFVRVDLVTIRSVGTGTLRCSLTGDCTVCVGCCGTGSMSGAGISAGMSSGSGGGVGGVSRSVAPQLFRVPQFRFRLPQFQFRLMVAWLRLLVTPPPPHIGRRNLENAVS